MQRGKDREQSSQRQFADEVMGELQRVAKQVVVVGGRRVVDACEEKESHKVKRSCFNPELEETTTFRQQGCRAEQNDTGDGNKVEIMVQFSERRLLEIEQPPREQCPG